MKYITLKISGGEFGAESSDDNVEIITEGKLYRRNGKTYLKYDESEISGFKGCSTTLTLEPGRVKMRRQGEDRTSDEIIFEAGKRFFSEYETPMGMMPLEVLTNNIKNTMDEDGYGEVDIDYHISLEGLVDGRNQLKIQVSQ